MGISQGYTEILSERKPTEQRHMRKIVKNTTADILSFLMDIFANQESLLVVGRNKPVLIIKAVDRLRA